MSESKEPVFINYKNGERVIAGHIVNGMYADRGLLMLTSADLRHIANELDKLKPDVEINHPNVVISKMSNGDNIEIGHISDERFYFNKPFSTSVADMNYIIEKIQESQRDSYNGS